MALAETLEAAFGRDGLHWSCLGRDGESKLRALVIEALRTHRAPREPVIFEIGTHQGVSSVILAEYGRVITVDVKDWPLRQSVWDHFGVSERCTFVPVHSNGHILELVKYHQFDLAFIDGNHEFESVKPNFRAVKKCGRVIFHDYTHNEFHQHRTVKFVDSIPIGRVTKLPPFALWEAPRWVIFGS